MAILQLINQQTVNEPWQYLGDVVCVVPDGTPEQLEFTNLRVNGSVLDVQAVLRQIQPEIRNAYLNASGVWQLQQPDDITQMKRVWRIRGSNKWYNLVNGFKFPINAGSLTPEEKQLLETYDITHSSISSFINKVAKLLSADPANNIEERDLRNQNP